ncbi:MAG: HAD family hydrolase [Bdellovibrionales bacterium]|nr:HAD family hydrolase [Bdellovibrionales bacterium]
MNKAIFFDRDGTLIVDKFYLNNPKDVEYLPGVFSNLENLRDAGFLFVIVTNQSGIPRGWVSEENLHSIHKRMSKDFAIYNIEFKGYYYSPHMPESDHPDRKPNPGMLLRAAKDFNIDLTKSWMVGDKMSDVEAGHRAGTKTILIDTKGSARSSQYKPPTAYVHTFPELAQVILSSSV